MKSLNSIFYAGLNICLPSSLSVSWLLSNVLTVWDGLNGALGLSFNNSLMCDGNKIEKKFVFTSVKSKALNKKRTFGSFCQRCQPAYNLHFKAIFFLLTLLYCTYSDNKVISNSSTEQNLVSALCFAAV